MDSLAWMLPRTPIPARHHRYRVVRIQARLHLEKMCVGVDSSAQRETHGDATHFGNTQYPGRNALLDIFRGQAVHRKQIVRAVPEQYLGGKAFDLQQSINIRLAASANRKLAWIPVQADAPDGCGLRTAPGTRDSTISRQVSRL